MRFDEALVEAQATDTLATALIAAGALMTSRSAKYRRPRGPYCLSGDCGTCLVRVDGRPNVRACTTAVREGMRVSSQNSYKPRRLDPTAIVDHLFPGGMDHHHLMVRPRLANELMQAFARNLTGFGELPEGVGERACEHVDHHLPVVIVGAGAAGRAAAATFERLGVDHLVVERRDRAQLEAALAEGEALPAQLVARCGAFGLYPGPWSPAGEVRAVLATSEIDRRVGVSGGGDAGEGEELERLRSVRPRHLIFATGSRDPMIPFANNDLPGIVAARGLIRALRRADARIAGRCVVVGEGEWAETQRAALDALRSPGAPRVECVAPEDIERAVGGDRLEALLCRGGRISCALLAVAARPAAAHELPAMAGVELRFDGAGFCVVREAQGRCGSLGATSLWACGDLCGFIGDGAAARDGARVAEAVVSALALDAPSDRARHFVPVEPPAPPVMRERPVVGDAFADPEPAPEPASDGGQP
nr:(2Fe-2S)-binding protein [Pseudenhygromyxa sp. WMMC2535]